MRAGGAFYRLHDRIVAREMRVFVQGRQRLLDVVAHIDRAEVLWSRVPLKSPLAVYEAAFRYMLTYEAGAGSRVRTHIPAAKVLARHSHSRRVRRYVVYVEPFIRANVSEQPFAHACKALFESGPVFS